jgi:hypothetical protein
MRSRFLLESRPFFSNTFRKSERRIAAAGCLLDASLAASSLALAPISLGLSIVSPHRSTPGSMVTNEGCTPDVAGVLKPKRGRDFELRRHGSAWTVGLRSPPNNR